jgi:hypothetical protein
MRIEEGQIIELEDNKEYVVLKTLEYNNETYVYLITSSKPIEVLFRKEQIINDEIILEPIDDSELANIIPLFEN